MWVSRQTSILVALTTPSQQLMGSDLDIEEATCVAAASNDVSGLIADVLMRLR
jgi:hypothetical protein